VKIVVEADKIVVKDNHEKDTAQGQHVLDMAEAADAEDDRLQSDESASNAHTETRNFPILDCEIDQHRWSASTDGYTVSISSDSTPAKMSLPLNWLRDNCPCSQCLQASTQQRLHKSSDYFASNCLSDTRVEIREQGTVTGIHVNWAGVHAGLKINGPKSKTHASSFFPLKDLVRKQASTQYTSQSPIFFPSTTWDKEGLLKSPTLRVAYEAFKSSPTALHATLSQVVSHGLVVLTGVPTDITSDTACELRNAMQQIGEIRNTLYGPTWDVKALKDSKNIAYTDVDLGFHQDLL
jgi:gamma-butyrobetaine dioxygenase